jgi:hypothetical protein
MTNVDGGTAGLRGGTAGLRGGPAAQLLWAPNDL